MSGPDDGPGDGGEPAREPLVALHFLVRKTFRRRFKRRALEAGTSQRQLLFRMLDLWESQAGVEGPPEPLAR